LLRDIEPEDIRRYQKQRTAGGGGATDDQHRRKRLNPSGRSESSNINVRGRN
jgi:hypothetical protein